MTHCHSTILYGFNCWSYLLWEEAIHGHGYKEVRIAKVGGGCLGGCLPQLARLEYIFIETLKLTLNLMLGVKEKRRKMSWLSQGLVIIYDSMHREDNKWGMKHSPVPSKT